MLVSDDERQTRDRRARADVRAEYRRKAAGVAAAGGIYAVRGRKDLVDRGRKVLHTQQRLSRGSIDALTRQAFDIAAIVAAVCLVDASRRFALEVRGAAAARAAHPYAEREATNRDAQRQDP